MTSASTKPTWSPSALVSGGLLVASGLLPWVADGPGSSYRGVELAAALRNSAIVPTVARWAGLVVLAVALVGVGHLASLSFTGKRAVWARGLSAAVVLLFLIAVSFTVGLSRWGTGLWSAAIGSLVAVAVAIWTAVTRSTDDDGGAVESHPTP